MRLNFINNRHAIACQRLWYILLLLCFLSACRQAEETTKSADLSRSLLRDDDQARKTETLNQDQPFSKAINQATKAATLAQSAKTETEWKAVVEAWSQAIALMKAVPKNDKNYAIAQQKIAEYQKNLDIAQRKAKAAL